ncbi:MAG: ORF6N domain-containing protein, partial [Candidatus Binatota bacterium]
MNRPKNLKSQFAISSSGWGGRRHPPYVFTEQGVAMLSSNKSRRFSKPSASSCPRRSLRNERSDS